ncbi:MAG: HAD family hydrolase [Planctomycetota bacterium]|jgi:hypothetical protein
MLRSYDIDGVITAGVRPVKPCIIVSGRKFTSAEKTHKQFQQLGIDPTIAVYLRPNGAPADRQSAGMWKALIIGQAGVTEHWEDDPLQADIVKKMTGVKVVFVNHGVPVEDGE